LVTVTDGDMPPSSFIIITCCYPSSPIVHRCAPAITPVEGSNIVAVAHPYLLRTAAVTLQHIVRGADAAPRSSVMRSRSVTIVRHHHPFFIIITPCIQQSDRQRSG
jgi:hypothetical protein